MMRGTIAAIFAVFPAAIPLTAQIVTPIPAFDAIVSLRSAEGVAISPDGRSIAYQVRSANWKEDRFDREIWLVHDTLAAFQLTRTPDGSSESPRWSPDGHSIAFLSDRGHKKQIYLVGVAGGEARPLTEVKDGVSDFRWAPDGKHIAYTAVEVESDTARQREERYGQYSVVGEDYRQTHLWMIDVPPDSENCSASVLPDTTRKVDSAGHATPTCLSLPIPRRLTEGSGFTVSSFEWAPDGSQIAFERRHDPLVNSDVGADIYLLVVATREVRPVITTPGFDGSPIWSPDSKWILYSTAGGDTSSYYYRNAQIAKVSVGGGPPIRLAVGFDEDINDVAWTPAGIFFLAWQRTKRYLFRLDPVSNETRLVGAIPDDIMAMSFSRDGRAVALLGRAPTTLPEVYRATVAPFRPTSVTSLTTQIAGWPIGASEVISWTSKDGAQIEGVLTKPPGFDPHHRYPLLVVIHGGPTGISVPTPVATYVYPITQWVARGVLILQPNYRGSAGYGERFRSLNVRNLGIGDAWDVLSGVDALIGQGFVDTTRMGAMGWSQGGYVSAFLTTTTRRFKAISIGAGISDWMTYYVNTDIHPFTREYLLATPWSDSAIYARTSPITYIRGADTPTLIQHGEVDRRVPIANGYELYQALQDMHVPVEMIVYHGFGHVIDKPRELLAATWHNWHWFAKYVWNEDVQLPLGAEPHDP